MKITGGKFRGRNIESVMGRSVRPTTSRVREAIFNLLKHGKFKQHESYVATVDDCVEGQTVVDIFCGTGILGLEAISRGAKEAVLIDESTQSVDVARKNAKHLGANATVIRSDSTKLPKAKTQAMLAFLDPPYKSGLAKKGLISLSTQGWLGNGAIAIVEVGGKEVFNAPESFTLLDERIYNKTRLLVLQYNE